MPVGPSHSGRGGGGGFGGPRGGGPHHDPHHGPRPSASSSFVNGMIGGMIGASIANRRRERFEQRYGIRPSDDEISALPTRSKPIGFLILAIFVAVVTFFTVIIKLDIKETLSENKEYFANMESSWTDVYKPMLDKVNATGFVNGTDDYYVTTATFNKSKIEYYGNNPTTSGVYVFSEEGNYTYYFIVYKYTNNEGKTKTGTTYADFTDYDINKLDGEIKIAFKGENPDPINTNYTLDNSYEYSYYKDLIDSEKSTSTKTTIAIVIEVLVLALFITLYVLKLKKYYKLVAADEELLFQKKKAETAKATAEANAAASRLNRYCKYCGCKIDADSNVCSSCGAKLTK